MLPDISGNESIHVEYSMMQRKIILASILGVAVLAGEGYWPHDVPPREQFPSPR